TANAHGTYSGTGGIVLSFTGSATDPSSVDTTAGFTFHWNFGDGNASTSQNPTHVYTASGSYAITFTATDKDGATGTATTTASIHPAVAVPHTTATRTVNEGSPLTLTGSVSGGATPL